MQKRRRDARFATAEMRAGLPEKKNAPSEGPKGRPEPTRWQRRCGRLAYCMYAPQKELALSITSVKFTVVVWDTFTPVSKLPMV